MLELYHNDMSTCAQKVRLTLAEKGLKWKSHHMDLRKGETRTEVYKKLNPAGVVPTLIDNGTIICESTVIMEYLDDAYPKVLLRPKSAKERALMRGWTKQLDEGVHAATAVVSTVNAFRFQWTEGRTWSEIKELAEKIPDAARRERQLEIFKTGIDSEFYPPALKRFDKLFSDMELCLKDNVWLAGQCYSLADIAYTPYLTRFDHLHALGVLDKRPRLSEWYEKVKERPNYTEAIVDWLNEKYLKLMKEKGEQYWPKTKTILSS